MILSDICLSVYLFVAYIGPKWRIERPRKTKIGTEVALTRDSDTTFKVKDQGHEATFVGCTGRPTWTYSNGLTFPYAYMTYIVSPLAGLGGVISWRPPAYSLFKNRKGNVFLILSLESQSSVFSALTLLAWQHKGHPLENFLCNNHKRVGLPVKRKLRVCVVCVCVLSVKQS